ncbi:MAG: hypothetical protein ACFFB5_08115 [Promethearchaeota archaeon]
MAIGKDQALTQGRFYPSSDKKVIYQCALNNTTGFLKDITIFSVLIGFFTFLIMQSLAFLAVLLSWIIIVPWLTPKHYKFLQIDKHVITYGTGSIFALLRSKMKTIYILERNRYRDIHYLRLDRWIRKKFGGKMDSFGRVQIKVNNSKPIFHMLIESTDFTKLVKILEAHRFDSKVQKTLSRGELMLIFPSSPRYTTTA